VTRLLFIVESSSLRADGHLQCLSPAWGAYEGLAPSVGAIAASVIVTSNAHALHHKSMVGYSTIPYAVFISPNGEFEKPKSTEMNRRAKRRIRWAALCRRRSSANSSGSDGLLGLTCATATRQAA
jgi:hypothetical protein